MSSDWPESLVDDLCDRKVIVVIGAGVSKWSDSTRGDSRNPPLWKELLENAVKRYKIGDRHIRLAIKEGDYLSACEWIRYKIDEDWMQFINDEFISPSYSPNLIHDKLFRLDQRVTFSLNFDKIYESFVLSSTMGRTLVKQYHDNDVYRFLRDRSDYVIKLHGSVDTPKRLIFSESDYAEARADYASFYEVLDASILSHTFIFVGCGFNDPNIKLLLGSHKFKFPGAQPHYIITDSRIHKHLERSIREARNLKCIKYDYDDTHGQLSVILDNLLKEVEERRANAAV